MDREDVTNCVGGHDLAKDGRHHWGNDFSVDVYWEIVVNVRKLRRIQLVANRHGQTNFQAFARSYVQRLVPLWLFSE